MSFVDNVKLPNTGVSKDTSIKTTSPSLGGGGFLSNVIMPKNPEQAVKIAGLKQEANVNKQVAQEANSPMGLLKETVKGIPNVIGNFFSTGLKKGIESGVINSGVTSFINKPNIPQKLPTENLLPSVTQTLGELKIDPAGLKANPKQTLNDVASSIKESINKAGDSISNVFSKYSETPTTAGRIGAGFQAAADIGGALFSPITALFAGANDIPVLNSITKIITLPFNFAGDIGKQTGKQLVKELPISEDVKKQITGGLEDLTSLIAQMVVGGKLAESTPGVKEIISKIKEKYSPTDANTIINKATEIAKNQIEEKGIHPEIHKEVQDVITKNGSDVAYQKLKDELGMTHEQAKQTIETSNRQALAETRINRDKVIEEIKQKHTEEPIVTEKVYQGIKENGGITIDVKGNEPNKGYAYAPDKTTEYSVSENDFHQNYQKHIDLFTEKNKDLLAQPGNHIGGWVDNGKVYLDISRVGEPSAKTIAEAQKGEQLGVYDLETGKTISTGQITEKGYTKLDEATNIHDKYRRENSTTNLEGGKISDGKISEGTKENRGKEKIERPISPEGTRVTKSANVINEKLVNEGIKKLPLEEQSKYKAGSYKRDKENSIKLMTEDFERAKRIATGKEEVPENIKYPQILYNAMEAHAIKVNDVPLLMDLAKSKLGTELSEAAGTLGSHGYNDNPTSPVQTMQKIQQARERVAEKRLKDGKTIKEEIKNTKEKIREEIKKKAPTKQSWTEFINSIKC